MKLFSLFKSRDKPVKNSTVGSSYSFFMGGSTAGKAVNERSAMQMTCIDGSHLHGTSFVNSLTCC